MLKGFAKIFRLEIIALAKSPKRIFYVLVFPIVLFTFLGALFNSGSPRDLSVGYLDLNQSKLSTKLIRMLDATSSMKLDKKVANLEEAKKMVQSEAIYAFIVIPEDFTKKISKGMSTDVVCYTNNQFLMPAGLIQKDFLQTIGTFSAGVTLNRETQQSVQLQKAMKDVQPVLTDVHVLYNPYSNYAYYLLTIFLPTILHMVVMMITVYVIGVEFKNKNASLWYKRSGWNSMSALLGKLLPYTICLFFVGWWMNYFLFYRIGVPLKTGLINVTLITTLLIIIYQLIGISIVSIAKDFRGALTIGSGFTALALSFAAYTFPIEGFPLSMQYLAKVFPLTHFVEYYINRAVKGVPITYAWQPVLSIVLFVVLFIITYPKFVQRLKSGGYE